MFCSNCGNEVKTGGNFCNICGAKLANANPFAISQSAYGTQSYGARKDISKPFRIIAIITVIIQTLLCLLPQMTVTDFDEGSGSFSFFNLGKMAKHLRGEMKQEQVVIYMLVIIIVLVLIVAMTIKFFYDWCTETAFDYADVAGIILSVFHIIHGIAYSKLVEKLGGGGSFMGFDLGTQTAFGSSGRIFFGFVLLITCIVYIVLKKSRDRVEEYRESVREAAVNRNLYNTQNPQKKWVCPNCGQENASYIGTCSCGTQKPNFM